MVKLLDGLDAGSVQAALTERFLRPALPELEAFFLAMRAQADPALAARIGTQYGKAYPYGSCLEITTDVMWRLGARDAWPDMPGAQALKAFLDHGGEGQMLWGVLRDSYFQNAIQLGTLYVDVSNDTVDVRKPKVEILPMKDSGFALVRDAAHFVRIGEAYWNARLYVNTALPALAPAFPMILVDRDGKVGLMARVSYVMAMFANDGFRLAEQWLREGPTPPVEAVHSLRSLCSRELLAANPRTGVDAAVSACQQLRAAGVIGDNAWIDAMFAAFDKAPVARMASRSFRGILDERRANSRPLAGIAKLVA